MEPKQFLYLTEQGAYVKKEALNLVIRKGGSIISEEKIVNLSHISVFGNIQFSSQALSSLLYEGVEVSFFSMKGGFKGRLSPSKSKNIRLRLNQYERYFDILNRSKLAARLIYAKIKNALYLLSSHLKNHPEICDLIESERKDLEKSLYHIQELQKTCSKDLARSALKILLGCEGSATRTYFSAFSKCFSDDSPLKMKGRTKYPPKDPINALLSLGYSLLTSELNAFIDGLGLEPYLGFYHEPRHARPSLALDLIEQLRHPCIDHLVLRIVNLRSLSMDDFETIVWKEKKAENRPAKEGVYLKKNSLKKYLALYERWMRNPFSITLEKSPYTEWIKNIPGFKDSEDSRNEEYKISINWRTFIHYYVTAFASFISKWELLESTPLILLKRN